MNDITVLITNCGGPGIGGLIDSLRLQNERKIRIVGVDCNSDAAGRYLVDQFLQIARIDRFSYIDTLLSICEENGVDVLLPLSSSELRKLRDARPDFWELGTMLPNLGYRMGNTSLLNITLDKAECYEHFQEISPAYEIPRTDKSLADCARALGNYKICMKPRISSGSRGFIVLADNIKLYELLSSKHCNVRNLGVLGWMHFNGEVVLMEYLPGTEYSVDILANNGDMLYCIPRIREAVKDGVTSVGKVDLKEEIIDMCGMITKDLLYTGNLNIQLKYDRNDKPKLIEINPRLSGTVSLCTAAGANLVYWGVKQMLGEPIPEVEVKDGVKMVRYLKEIYINDHCNWQYERFVGKGDD